MARRSSDSKDPPARRKTISMRIAPETELALRQLVEETGLSYDKAIARAVECMRRDEATQRLVDAWANYKEAERQAALAAEGG